MSFYAQAAQGDLLVCTLPARSRDHHQKHQTIELTDYLSRVKCNDVLQLFGMSRFIPKPPFSGSFPSLCFSDLTVDCLGNVRLMLSCYLTLSTCFTAVHHIFSSCLITKTTLYMLNSCSRSSSYWRHLSENNPRIYPCVSLFNTYQDPCTVANELRRQNVPSFLSMIANHGVGMRDGGCAACWSESSPMRY